MNKPEKNESKWRTKKEIAAHFGICERSVTNLQRRRILPYVKLGRVVRFDLDECDAAVKKLEFKSTLNCSTPATSKV